MFATLALLAVLFEAALGYPHRLSQQIGHPVMWIGALIAWCDRQWNSNRASPLNRRVLGALALALCLIVVLAITFALIAILANLLPGFGQVIFTALFASTLIAQRSLYDHVANVASSLRASNLSAARNAVAKIVGRDTETLNEAGIARAAIESLAENFSDGVVAPVFWLCLAGLPGISAYKTINTADSMIGHKSPKYIDFGWATARTDDLVNWPAARLSALFITIAAFFIPSANAINAMKCAQQDARSHRSPNAGWPEAAFAGALGLKLAGPRIYEGKIIEDNWMGDGSENVTADDIRSALNLYTGACIVQAAILALLVIIFAFL